jgi:hypothetical protein
MWWMHMTSVIDIFIFLCSGVHKKCIVMDGGGSMESDRGQSLAIVTCAHDSLSLHLPLDTPDDQTSSHMEITEMYA